MADLDDRSRARRLAQAVRDTGALDLRHDGGDGAPLAGGVEAGIVADALAAAVADVAFAGPVLAADLARRAGCWPLAGAMVAFSPDLISAAIVPGPATATPLHAVDCGIESRDEAYVLVAEGAGYRLAQVRVDGASRGVDLTRTIRSIPAGARLLEVSGQTRTLGTDDLAAWTALGLALTSADLVGLMWGCSSSPSPTPSTGGSTASPSGRSRPCSTSSPRLVASWRGH